MSTSSLAQASAHGLQPSSPRVWRQREDVPTVTRRSGLFVAVAPLVALLLLSSCDDDSAPPASAAAGETVGSGDVSGGGAGGDTPTWHGAVAPIVMDRCAGCHGPGGIAAFALDTPEAWADWGAIAVASMQAGRMPPWLPAQGCGEFAHPLHLEPAQVGVIEAWLKAGRPLGDASKATPLPEKKKLVPTHTLAMPQPYTPPPTTLDDYRCFLLDFKVDEELYVRGTQVLPGATSLVHHVLVYALEGDMLSKAEAADAKDSVPGYTCFGSPQPSGSGGGGGIGGFSGGFPNQIAAWVPGISPRVLPPELALRLRKGSRIVMQVHYNLASGKTETDTSSIQLVIDTKPPERVLVTRPLIIEALNIPAGQDNVVHERLYRYYGKGEVQVHSVSPHMHLLGSEFRSEVVRKDGSKECVVDIPEWDFAWQMGYGRPKDKPIVLKDGDGMTIRCVYDNTEAHQPIVGGRKLTPRNVKWGEGTTDEMCLLYLDMSEAFTPPAPAGQKACVGADTCTATCSAGPMSCLYGCDNVAKTCGTCAISQIVSCTSSACGGKLLGAQACLTRCMISSLMFGTNADLCLAAECGDAWAQARACIDPKLSAGDCDQKLSACGVAFKE